MKNHLEKTLALVLITITALVCSVKIVLAGGKTIESVAENTKEMGDSSTKGSGSPVCVC